MEWIEYPFNPIALASTGIAKDSLFCNAIANAQCERNLKVAPFVSTWLIWQIQTI